MKNLILIIAILVFSISSTTAQTELFFQNPTTSGEDNQIGYTAIYENIATINGQSIELKATVADASDASDVTSFGFASDSGHDFRFNMRDDRVAIGESIFAEVKFEFFYTGTHTPVDMTLDLTHDNITEDTKSIDQITTVGEELAAYTIENPTTLNINNYTFTGTQHSGNNNDPQYATTFHYENASSFSITYEMIKKSNNSTTIFFRVDGNGDLVEFNNEIKVPNTSLLPLDLIEFNANLEYDATEINWITENEEVLSHFNLERSNDGIKFETIETIAAKGENGDLTYYATTDYDVNNGQNYYRLKSVDFDGTFYYSEIEVVELSKESNIEVQVYPNPTTDWVKVRAESTVETLNVIDLNGRTLINNTIQDSFGQVNVSNLPKGQYFININLENGEFMNQTIIIQ